jgi:fermentation-respiration switch protein FrsA (DUF1100 family)
MKKIISALVARIVIYPILVVILLSLFFFYLYVFPKRTISRFDPGQWRMQYQDLTLTTRDGLKLSAWFIPNKKSEKAIIVCHGYPMDKGNIFGVTDFLAKDYNLLYFDFRAMGKSQGRVSTSGWREREDFLSAVRFLKEKGFNDIGAFGFSMGAAVIFMADSPDIKCIVSDSSYARLETAMGMIFRNFGFLKWPLKKLVKIWSIIFLRIDMDSVAPVNFIARLNRPILLIHCRTDTLIPVTEALELRKANSRSELLLIPEGDHGESVFFKDYELVIMKFFKAHL